MSPFDRLMYEVSQGVRSAWFGGHYAVAMRLAPRIEASPARSMPSWSAIRTDLEDLFRRDWAHVETGLYPAPDPFGSGPVRAIERSLAFFRDLAAVNRRRRAGDALEVARAARHRQYPRYYLQNFHFQSGGYLSGESARLYDHQVEVLFTGGADAMRRQALAPLVEVLRGQSQRRLHHLDIGCGTGRFLTFVKDALPRLRVTGLDLSRPYLEEAAATLRRWSRTALVEGNAEALPFADACFDSVSCLFLFHELPRSVRARVAGEMARVLKAGGRAVFLDSIQLGDWPDYDALLERFPIAFHEPFYGDYVRQDLRALFASAGFSPVAVERAFFAKAMVLAR